MDQLNAADIARGALQTGVETERYMERARLVAVSVALPSVEDLTWASNAILTRQ